MSNLDVSAAAGLSEPKLEALVEAMLLAATADEDFSDDERKHFKESVRSLSDGRLTDARLDALINRALADLEREGRSARLVSVRDRLPEQGARKVALELAVQMTAADGIIRTSERELLLEAAEVWEIDGDEAADLVVNSTR